MTRTPATFKQADIARALRAAKQSGVDAVVRLLPDGSIVIDGRAGRDDTQNEALEARAQYQL